MKNTILKSFVGGLTFFFTIFLCFVGYAVWQDLTEVETTDTLTKDRWNEMVNKLNTVGTKVDTLSNVPTGAVMAFNLTSCPTGWSEYIPARGIFIRGIDSTGTNDVVRTLGSYQEDTFQGHKHSLSGLQNTAFGGGSTHWNNAPGYSDTWSSQLIGSPISDGVNGIPRTSSETRPKNVALLYCEKQ